MAQGLGKGFLEAIHPRGTGRVVSLAKFGGAGGRHLAVVVCPWQLSKAQPWRLGPPTASIPVCVTAGGGSRSPAFSFDADHGTGVGW